MEGYLAKPVGQQSVFRANNARGSPRCATILISALVGIGRPEILRVSSRGQSAAVATETQHFELLNRLYDVGLHAFNIVNRHLLGNARQVGTKCNGRGGAMGVHEFGMPAGM